MFEGRVENVVEGRNRQLFIADRGAPDSDIMLAEDTFPSYRLKLWRQTLEMHASFLAERSIPYVILVAPDSFNANAGDLPEGWPRPADQVGRVFAEAMAGISNLTVVYPLQALWQADGGLPIYKKNDTHWSAYGAFVAYREMLKALPPELAIRRIEACEVTFAWKDFYGDLGSHAKFDRKLPTPVPHVNAPSPVVVRRGVGALRRGLLVTRNEAAAARALIFRDSFATEMGPYLFATFGEMWSLGASQVLAYDLVDEVKPDVVILQASERRLLSTTTDHGDLGWRELHEVDMKCPAGQACTRLLQLLDTRAFQEAADLAPAVAAGDGLQPQHLIHCALACYRAERLDEAGLYARRAVQLDPSFASAWRLIALAELESPNPDEKAWSGAARRMLRLAPRNALYRHEYAYGLGAFGHHAEALAASRAAIEEFPDYPALRVQLARALYKSGDPAGALEALTPALELLDPQARPHQIAERLRAGQPWKA